MPVQHLPAAGRVGECHSGGAVDVGDIEPTIADPCHEVHDSGQVRIRQDGDRGRQDVTLRPGVNLVVRDQDCVTGTDLDRKRALAAGHDRTLPAPHGPPVDVRINIFRSPYEQSAGFHHVSSSRNASSALPS